MKRIPTSLSFSRLFAAAVLSACAYVFFEWLFIVTKPSFMNVLPWGKKVEILGFSAALLAAVCAAALLPLLLIDRLAGARVPGGRARAGLVALGALVPAAVLGALALLMIDNFTYTVFHFGIVSTHGVTRGLYALLLLGLIGLCWRNLLPALAAPRSTAPTRTAPLAGGSRVLIVLLGLLALGLAVPLLNRDALSQANRLAQAQGARPLTHVILITSDGVTATHLSLYGYARDTTPYLRRLAASSLVMEDNFSNANKTDGSIISIYTGKYPSQTRLLYPPDILRGADAYEHLPGILRALGYHTVQLTVPHFADAFTSNVLEGFDLANGQPAATSRFMAALNKRLSNDFAYFIYELGNRLLDRVRHIFYIKEMKASVELVTNPTGYSDLDRLQGLLDLFKDPRQPVFVHIHLLGTHGAKFYPDQQVFSKGKAAQAQGNYDPDFYDDSILEFDGQVRGVVNELARRGLLDQSLLIIGSDHAADGATGQRIPLLMRFPHGAHAGRINVNTQNMDIVPTILDALGLPVPSWMSGQSLLRLNGAQRPILTFTPSALLCTPGPNGTCILDPSQARPPFYQLGSLVAVDCQTWYQLDLVKKTWASGAVPGSTAACPAAAQLTGAQVFQAMLARLKADGFDTRSLAGKGPEGARR